MVTEEAIARLRSAAADGVDGEGLRVGTDGETFEFATPDATYEGLSAAEFETVARRHGAYVSEWYFWTVRAPEAPDRRAFLRWVERADERPVPERRRALERGTTREWGQVQVTAAMTDGRRRYDLRHVADADTPRGELSVHTDPLEARRLAKRDDDGRYRPLSTAPTLRTGWLFAGLDPAELVRAVDCLYPATIANWHREREGELDVTHWHEAVSRQTGIYGVVKTWDRGEGHEHVDWVAEACCVDSQCLKRREWEYDEDTDLGVDGGDGVFPCREPCSLVIAAARRWTRLEAEQARTYEFELTPSEKDQIETIIDAVANGRTDEIREADIADGANRYRARFLRAKRMDESGNLCGVPTEPEQDATDGGESGGGTGDGSENEDGGGAD